MSNNDENLSDCIQAMSTVFDARWEPFFEGFQSMVGQQRLISSLAGYKDQPTKSQVVEAGFALVNEVNEFIDELDWKSWKTSEIDKEKVAEEFADVMAFFFLNAAIACDRAGLGPGDLVEAYKNKSIKNVKRMFGLSGEPGYGVK